MLRNMEPPLGFGNKCPYRLAHKKLIRMNMPIDEEGKVQFTTTLFALIRENLSIKMRPGEYSGQQTKAWVRRNLKPHTCFVHAFNNAVLCSANNMAYLKFT